MSGLTGGKSWWWSLWRSLVLAAATFVAGVLVSLLYLWWRDALSAVHFAYCLYALGGLVAAGYVLVLLGKNSAVGVPGLTPPPTRTTHSIGNWSADGGGAWARWKSSRRSSWPR